MEEEEEKKQDYLDTLFREPLANQMLISHHPIRCFSM